MNEDDEQESYMFLDEIEEQMDYRMSRRSIITWTKWLVRGGWLLEIPDKTAADNGFNVDAQLLVGRTRSKFTGWMIRKRAPCAKLSPVHNLHQCNLHTRFLVLVLVLLRFLFGFTLCY